VNFPGEFSAADRQQRQDRIGKIFKTSTGRKLAESLFLG